MKLAYTYDDHHSAGAEWGKRSVWVLWRGGSYVCYAAFAA